MKKLAIVAMVILTTGCATTRYTQPQGVPEYEKKAAFNALAACITSSYKQGYYPGVSPYALADAAQQNCDTQLRLNCYKAAGHLGRAGINGCVGAVTKRGALVGSALAFIKREAK